MNYEQEPLTVSTYIERGQKGSKESDGGLRKKNRGMSLRIRVLVCSIILIILCSGGIGLGSLAKAKATENETEAAYAETAAASVPVGIPQEEVKDEAYAEEPAPEPETAGILQDVSAAETETPAETADANPEAMTSLEEILALLEETQTSSGEDFTGLGWDAKMAGAYRDYLESEGMIEEIYGFSEDAYAELIQILGIDGEYESSRIEAPESLSVEYNPDFVMDLTEEELAVFLTLVESEAPSEDIYGKILVANVVLNRVLYHKFAGDVKGVIFEKVNGTAQFSPTAIDWYWNSIVVTDSTREAVARCLAGEDYSDGALYFYAWERNPGKHERTPWMMDLEYLFTYGGHTFLKESE